MTDEEVVLTLTVLAGVQRCANIPCKHVSRRHDGRDNYIRDHGYFCHCCKKLQTVGSAPTWQTTAPSLRDCNGEPL